MTDSKEPWCIRKEEPHTAVLGATLGDLTRETERALAPFIPSGLLPTSPKTDETLESLRRIEEWIRQFDERVVFVHGKCFMMPEYRGDFSPREPIAGTIASAVVKTKRGDHRVLEIRPWVQCAGVVLSVPEPFVFERVQVNCQNQILSPEGVTREVVLSCGLVTPDDIIVCHVVWPE